MTRLLGLAAAIAAAAALTAPTASSANPVTFCGGTFRPPCDTCFKQAGGFCVPVTVDLGD